MIAVVFSWYILLGCIVATKCYLELSAKRNKSLVVRGVRSLFAGVFWLPAIGFVLLSVVLESEK